MTDEFVARILARGCVVECGEGWWPIIDQLDKSLSRIDNHYVLQQVKQKWGGLRFYAQCSVREPTMREAFDLLIQGAEELAAQTCEICGARGRMHRTTAQYVWFKTLCGACALTESRPGREYTPTDDLEPQPPPEEPPSARQLQYLRDLRRDAPHAYAEYRGTEPLTRKSIGGLINRLRILQTEWRRQINDLPEDERREALARHLADVLTHPCPHCNAGIGEPCLRPSGFVMDRIHLRRPTDEPEDL